MWYAEELPSETLSVDNKGLSASMDGPLFGLTLEGPGQVALHELPTLYQHCTSW